MSVEMDCPKCRTRRAVSATAGRALKCQACGETLIAVADATRGDDFIEPAWGDAKPSATVTVTAVTTTAIPNTIGRFAIRGKLGAGAFGTVYRAYDPQLDRVVALKVPNPGIMTDAKRAERFLREAKAAANLHHPHIVPVFDAGKDGDSYYIASAFIGGKPLADEIPESGTDFPRAARLVRELAEALAYAHEQGVVHRDVKPANIMLDTLDRVHLMDFGLASRQEEAGKLTNDGAVMGTPSYMSPEQARGQHGDARPPTDQYAAGVVLYELLTGRTPFSGPPAVVIAAVLTTEPEPPHKLRPDVPRDLETICLKAMSKKPEDRYSDCRALADDLRRWLDGEPVVARPLGLAERATRWLKKEPKLTVAAAAVVVALLVSVVVVSGAARRADAALQAANQSAADREAAEERERQAAGSALGAIGTAVEERKKAERFFADANAEREKAKAERDNAERHRERATDADARAATDRKKAEAEEAAAVAERAKVAAAQMRIEALELAVDEERKKAEAALTAVKPVPPELPVILHRSGAVRAAFSPDGKRVVTAGSDGTARVWNAGTGAEQLTLNVPKAVNAKREPWPHSAAFSPNSKRIVTAAPGEVKVWDATTGVEQLSLPRPGNVFCVSFSPDGARILTGGSDGVARAWNAKSGDVMVLFKGHVGQVTSVAYSADERRVVTTGTDSTVRVWEAKTGLEVRTIKLQYAASSVSFSPDGTQVLTVSRGQPAQLWDVKTSAEVLSLAPTGGVHFAAFSPDGSRIVTADGDKTVRVRGAKTGAELLAYAGITTQHVQFCPDGVRVLYISAQDVKMLWALPPKP